MHKKVELCSTFYNVQLYVKHGIFYRQFAFLSLLTKQRYLFNLISPDYYSTFAIGL